jgi:long-chain acyl-CoA synthetase
VVLGRKQHNGSEVVISAVVYPCMEDFDDTNDHEAIEARINDQIKKMNRKLVSYKQIRQVEFRYQEFEKTTSRKIKRHLVG